MLRGSNYRVDPWQWCAKQKSMEGRLPLRACARLLPLLADPDGEVVFNLCFERTGDRHLVRGRVRAELLVTCQRCLEAMPLRVDANVAIAFVRGIDEAKRLPDDIDPYLVDEDSIDWQELVEDELILAIPATPRHELRVCAVELDSYSADEMNEKPDSPFAVLASLRGNRRGAD